MVDHPNLEDFADPDDYDRRDSSDTGVAFYAALARETGGPVLEIACGTGRVAIPIARRGFAVTGLDVVPGMLELARTKSAGLPARWVEGDARTFEIGRRFRLVFLTGNAFQLFLTNADQEALLGRVRAHLREDGIFAFETRNPRWGGRGEPDLLACTASGPNPGTVHAIGQWPRSDSADARNRTDRQLRPAVRRAVPDQWTGASNSNLQGPRIRFSPVSL